jgi:uncharacterized protein (TIGR02217 family)
VTFHETRFPDDISLNASGGPERKTDVALLGSGAEQRNARWADSRRRYDAGYGVKSLDELHVILAFFEERRGKLYGFRWKDHSDFKSCPPSQTPSATDQPIGTGNGTLAAFQLVKVYGASFSPWTRTITKPVAGTVRVAVAGVPQVAGVDYTVSTTTGVVTFLAGHIPASGAVTAGYEFDVPVRFDTDALDVVMQNYAQGIVQKIPVVEIRV